MDTIEYKEIHRLVLAMEDIARRLLVLEKIEARLSDMDKNIGHLVKQGS